jgi:hypothetical protein
MNRRLLRGIVEPVDGLHGLVVGLVLYVTRRHLRTHAHHPARIYGTCCSGGGEHT